MIRVTKTSELSQQWNDSLTYFTWDWNYYEVKVHFKSARFLQIMAKHTDCPVFTVFETIKTSSQNILITLSGISLKLQGQRSGYWKNKLPRTILEDEFPVPRNIAASKISNGVILLLWQLRCYCNPDHNKFSSLSNTAVVVIFQNLC